MAFSNYRGDLGRKNTIIQAGIGLKALFLEWDELMAREPCGQAFSFKSLLKNIDSPVLCLLHL